MKCAVYMSNPEKRRELWLDNVRGKSVEELRDLVLKGIEARAYEYVARIKLIEENESMPQEAAWKLVRLTQNDGFLDGWVNGDQCIYSTADRQFSTQPGDIFVFRAVTDDGLFKNSVWIMSGIDVVKIGGEDFAETLVNSGI